MTGDLDKIDVHHPDPANGDSLYSKDIKLSLCDVGTFRAGTDLLTLFNDLDASIVDSSATNPKWFKIYLERPIRVYEIGLVANTGTFKNVKISLLDRQGTVLEEIGDSGNSTAYKANVYRASLAKNTCCILFEFHTTSTITLSFVYARKVVTVEALIMGMDEATGVRTVAKFDNGEFIVGGQVKIKTAENNVVGADHGFPVLLRSFNYERYAEIDNLTYALATADAAHHELHEGNFFSLSDQLVLGLGVD